MLKISPSLLASDFARLADEINDVEAAGAHSLHVDVMDGHYVPNITIGPVVVKAIAAVATIPLDAHLMITDPLKYAPAFAEAGVSGLLFHPETVSDPGAALNEVRSLGVRAGLAVNPDSDIESFAEHIPGADFMLVMTVSPGFGGQEFMDSALENLRRTAALFDGEIAVDGGVSPETAARVVTAGGNVLVAGSAIFGHADRRLAIERLCEAAGCGGGTE